MTKKFAYIDAEYYGSEEPNLTPICASIVYDEDKISSWVFNSKPAQSVLKEDILTLHESGYIFYSWNVIAEGRFVQSLGIDPTELTWVDGYLEYRQLLNQNHALQYGRQLIKGKKIRTFPPKPKWQQTKEDKMKISNAKPQYNIGAATFKLLNKTIDTERKDLMRDIILSKDAELIEKNREEIMEYCDSDTEHLEELFKAQVKWYKKLLPPKEMKHIFDYMLFRSEFAARTSICESIGIPFDRRATKSLGMSIPYIKNNIIEHMIREFPEIDPYRWNKPQKRYSQNQKKIKGWISNQSFADRWERTAKGDFSLSKDAFEQHFHYRHTYPDDCFGGQMLRIMKTTSSLKGFGEKKKPSDKSFWDSVGSDDRSRPFFNIYGSQTGRSQPGSTGFLFLKSAWMRSLAVPPSGFAYGAVDFKSQEFLIGGIESHDMNMIRAYMSGDVYLWFAIKAGAAPKNATKKSHGKIRDKFKSTVLAMQYRMGAKSLAVKLTQDTGIEHDEDDAQELIDLFNDIFEDFAMWCEDILDQYDTDGYLKTRDGWFLFGDCENDKSVTNFPIQGAGGGILRYSVKRAQEAGLIVPQTLHDALYILFEIGDMGAIDTLMKAMDQGFKDYYEGHPLQKYANVGLDPQIWSPELEDGEAVTPNGVIVPSQSIYIDGRSKSEYKEFSKYFKTIDAMEIL